MFNHSKRDWVSAAITAALGAGIITSFAVGQGQNPLLALGITGFSAIAALIFDSFLSN